ncbi:hypothetical protein FNV43_RR10509 [Rhamnella rubrinervis]|uniref:Uncharacterized protein n=1 Tax=Rhamnella rubrinervis TaxID=2594499 RepID=A0A8K0H4G8_9ROSA|nr:hypothetical protein FNV43_RR10509 [Rhamnella rubrinervis]
MSSSSGTSNLRYRKTVRSTGSDNVLGSNNVRSPGAGFLCGRSLPPSRSKKINDNAKETQFSVRSSIPHETGNARQQPHDSQQIELTSIRRFQPLYQPFPIDIIFPPVSSQIATKKSFQPLNFEALNHQYHPLKSAVFSSLSRPVTKAPSPQKSTVAPTSSDGPIATSLIKGDGSKAFTYQSGTSEMHMSNTHDWKSIVMEIKRSEHAVKEMNELVDIANLMLDIDSRRHAYNRSRRQAYNRRFEEFIDSYNNSQLCPEKEDEICAMFDKEREDIEGRLAVLVPSFPFQAHPGPMFPACSGISKLSNSLQKSSQPITKGLSFQFDPLKALFASIRLPATKAPSPNKRSVASFSCDAPTTTTNLSKGDGSDQSGTSKMYLSNNKDDWKSFRISIEMLSPDGLRSLKTHGSQPCPEKEDEIFAIFCI